MKVADALRTSRISAGLTQKQVAEMLGVTPQFISDIEQDRRVLGDKYLWDLPPAIRGPVSQAMRDRLQEALSRINDAPVRPEAE